MARNILITRSYSRSRQLSQYLSDLKFNIYHQPLFDVEFINAKLENYQSSSSIIITSFNSCKAILASNFAKDIKIYAIGHQSCQILKDNGYNNIIIAKDRSVLSLIKLIKSSKFDKNHIFYYFRGTEVSYDLALDLRLNKYNIAEIICYKTISYDFFSNDFLKLVTSSKIDDILIYSQNSAKIFHNLAVKHNLIYFIEKCRIICFSQQIVDLVKNIDNQIWYRNTINYKDINFLKKFYD